MKLYPTFWVNASPMRKRIYSILFIFTIAILVTVIGTAVPLSSQDAYTISNQLNQTLAEHKTDNTLVPYIFFNNFTITLLMFIPLVGAALGMFILFDTGVALGAIAATQGYPAWLGLVSLIVTPVFWLEFVAYSLAMASSIWLFRRLLQRRFWELKWTGISILICALLLSIGAVVEVWLITTLGG